jgi:hypothetical protein
MRWVSLVSRGRQVRRNKVRTHRKSPDRHHNNKPLHQPSRKVKQSCSICKAGEGREKTPILDPTTAQINQKLLCGNCFKDYLRILRFSGPRFGRVKARAPPNGVWFSYGENNILFTQISGMWPCPACDEFYENLYDVVTHFAAKHTEIANKPNEKVTVNIDGKTVETLRTAQGYLICILWICRRER